MSNNAVGGVYQTIIEEVINSSRVDFEESGVEEAVLEELRLGWQQKLSQLDVARFPWDPKPDPPPPAASAPPPTSSAPTHTHAQFAAHLPLPTGPPAGLPQNGIKTEPGYVKQESSVPVKQEPGTQQMPMNPFGNYNGGRDNNKNTVAASRAAQQLQAQYGMRAAGSINAIQDRMGQQQQMQQQQPQQQQPQQPQHQHQLQHQQHQQQHLHQQQQHHHQVAQAPIQQQQQPQQQGQPTIGSAQTDGPGDFTMDDSSDDEETDFEGVLLQRGITGNVEELGRVEIDRMLHEQMAAKARSMEGGGLMLSLKEATKRQAASKASKKAKGKGKANAGVAAYDGGDDDEEVDEDAINSDLDDPDEDRDDDEVDDEGLGHIMLCMYDKVQRVKNKWKCTLKDGVLTVNGKEYVFNKATGEYEW